MKPTRFSVKVAETLAATATVLSSGRLDLRDDVDIINVDPLFRTPPAGSRIAARMPDSIMSCIGQMISALADICSTESGPTAERALQSSDIAEDLR